MNRTQLMVIAGFAVAFAAGGSVGRLTHSGTSGDQHSRRGGPAHLAKELELTPLQQEQMRGIWSDVMRSSMRDFRDRRSDLRKRRAEAVEALLSDQQRIEYDRIQSDYDRGRDKIDEERQQLVQQAVERTKAVLTESQAKKYEEMRAERSRRHGPGGRSMAPFGRDSGGEPSTRPDRRQLDGEAKGVPGSGRFGRQD